MPSDDDEGASVRVGGGDRRGEISRDRRRIGRPGTRGGDDEMRARGAATTCLAGEVHALERLVLAHVARDHALDLPRLEKQPQAEVVHASVVANRREPLRARVHQRRNEVLRGGEGGDPINQPTLSSQFSHSIPTRARLFEATRARRANILGRHPSRRERHLTSGIPQSPNPPTSRVLLLGMSATAAAADG